MSSPQTFPGPKEAGEHVVRWFDIEEETYASREKFGYQRNLAYAQESGLEPGSVLLDSQLTSYWSRAVMLDEPLRANNIDPLAARQQFAKHANAARAMFSTLLTQQFDGDYSLGKAMTREWLLNTAANYTEANALFTDSSSFDPHEYWNSELMPNIDRAQAAIRGNLPESTPWNDVVAQTKELERHQAALEPLGELLLDSFSVVTCYVFSDGPFPQPGLPSGDVEPWVTNTSGL